MLFINYSCLFAIVLAQSFSVIITTCKSWRHICTSGNPIIIKPGKCLMLNFVALSVDGTIIFCMWSLLAALTSHILPYILSLVGNITICVHLGFFPSWSPSICYCFYLLHDPPWVPCLAASKLEFRNFWHFFLPKLLNSTYV